MAEKKSIAPTIATVKRLFAVSGNQCAYPGCNVPVVEATGIVTGEIAHIKASSPNGPRYDKVQTEQQRHSFDNLILLCSRHHTVVDADITNHPADLLYKFKKEHEQKGAVEISPQTSSAAKVLLANYQHIVINHNNGQVAVNSPGAIQANNLTLKSTKQKVTISPPQGAIANNLDQRSYVEYLIKKYQDYQKLDVEKVDKYKYMAIYKSIEREFKSKWQLIPEQRFYDLVAFLYKRIDNSKIGRIRKARNEKRYHSFAEHVQA